MARITESSPRESADAVTRMHENLLIVQWVQQCCLLTFAMKSRSAGYSQPIFA